MNYVVGTPDYEVAKQALHQELRSFDPLLSDPTTSIFENQPYEVLQTHYQA